MYIVEFARNHGFRRVFTRKFNSLSDLAKFLVSNKGKIRFTKELPNKLSKQEFNIFVNKLISMTNKSEITGK